MRIFRTRAFLFLWEEILQSELLTTAEAAKQVGISRQWLHRLVAAGRFEAPPKIKRGRSIQRAWTTAHIERFRKFRKTLRRGRPWPKS
jgi:excisionase family DNA binding protein